MKRYIAIIVLLISIDSVAQTEMTDSIEKHLSLDEVVISASNITRVNDHLIVYPNEQQRKHTNSGYGVLKNLMIPGLIVNQSGYVEAMGMQASLYINGQECDAKEVQMIRPRDIEKIEYYDAPTGKYAKDQVAINFVLKQYRYGGYFQIEGLQTVGYTHGDYNIAGSINKGNTTYSLFTGSNYTNIDDDSSLGLENYILSQGTVARMMDYNTNYKKHNEYAQFRIQNQKGNRYFVGKVSLVSNRTPHFQSSGMLHLNDADMPFKSEMEQYNLSPKLDLNGNIPLSDNENISFGLHGKYSHNTYDRYYEELPFKSEITESENVGEFQLSAIYDRYSEKSSISAELYHYYNIWDAEYKGDANLWQHLWQSESLAFISYNYRFTKKFSIRSRVGLDWLQYRLHDCSKFSQLSPRFNLNLQYQFAKSMILGSFNYINSYHGMDIVNNAAIDINPYMVETGNPNLEKSHDINTYIYYSTKIRKANITAMCQYKLEHNPVMHDYNLENNKIIKSYTNNGDIQYFSIIAAVSYPLCEKMIFSGDLRYNYTQVNAIKNLYNNNITGNISMNLYAGNFAVSPYINFKKKDVNHTTLAVRKVPVNYGISCSYSNKNLFIEFMCVSPFTSRTEKRMLDMPYYTYNMQENSRAESKYCNIKLSYSLDFGRKTRKVKRDIDNNINSSLLRVTQ